MYKLKKSQKVLFFCIILLVLEPVIAIEINEIMYNPIGSDNNKEFVEIFMDFVINLTDYIISDSNANDTLVLARYNPNSSYALIVEDGYDYSNTMASVYTTGATIGNNLNNNGDEIYLYDNNGYLIDYVLYDNSIASNNDKSIEIKDNELYESIVEGGTPGYVNSIESEEEINNSINISEKEDEADERSTGEEDGEIEEENKEEPTDVVEEKDFVGMELNIILPNIVYSELEYKKLFKIINLDHKSGEKDCENVSLYYNIIGEDYYLEDYLNISCINSYKSSNTGKVFMNKTGTYTLCGNIISSSKNNDSILDNNLCKEFEVVDTRDVVCDIALEIETKKDVYYSGEKIKFDNKLNSEEFPFIISYYIVDIFGEVVKKRYNTTNTNKKSWTPKLKDNIGVYYIISEITDVRCNDIDKTNNNASKLIIAKNERRENSSIEIKKIYTGSDEVVKFGELLNVKAILYRGNTSKKSVKAYISKIGSNVKISEITYVYVNDKYKESELRIPIQIKQNCDNKYEDGNYKVVLEGMGINETAFVSIKGIKNNICYNNISQKKNIEYSLVEFSSNIISNQKFSNILKIINNDDTDHNFQVWSYVYKGSKCYSGERLGNLEKIEVKQGEEIEVELNNTVDAESGEYKYKVKIIKDDLKTAYEITKVVEVIELDNYVTDRIKVETNTTTTTNDNIIEENLTSINDITGMTTGVVYESKNKSIGKIINVFVVLIVLISLFIIIKRIKER